MILAITGHRPKKLGRYSPINELNQKVFSAINELNQKVFSAIRNALIEIKPERVITGMALGVDQYAAQSCIDLKIPFTAAIPCAKHDIMWPRSAREYYQLLLNHAATVFYVSDEVYTPWCMQKRNEWMVDNSDHLLAVWNGTKGGTANCIDYAKRIGWTSDKITNIWSKIKDLQEKIDAEYR